jgi:hypothetical protein
MLTECAKILEVETNTMTEGQNMNRKIGLAVAALVTAFAAAIGGVAAADDGGVAEARPAVCC